MVTDSASTTASRPRWSPARRADPWPVPAPCWWPWAVIVLSVRGTSVARRRLDGDEHPLRRPPPRRARVPRAGPAHARPRPVVPAGRPGRPAPDGALGRVAARGPEPSAARGGAARGFAA